MKQADDRTRPYFLKVSSILGAAVAFSLRASAEAFADSKRKTTPLENAVTRTSAREQDAGQAADKNAIRPFQVNIPETELTKLTRRIKPKGGPDGETVTDESQGVPLAKIQE